MVIGMADATKFKSQEVQAEIIDVDSLFTFPVLLSLFCLWMCWVNQERQIVKVLNNLPEPTWTILVEGLWTQWALQKVYD